MNIRSFLIIFIGILLLLLSYLLISGNLTTLVEESASSGKLKIATSFYPLYFFSTQIGKDKVVVKNITPSGAEPHDYDLTAQDFAQIEKSDLLIVNGGVEAWGDKIKKNLENKKTKIVTAGEGFLTENLIDNDQKITDPHIWLSPVLAKEEVKKITNALISIDQSNKDFYVQQETSLNMKLDELDNDYKTGLKNCQQRDFITTHQAFGYLAKEYGLNQIALSGISPDEEPSSAKLSEISTFAKQKNIHVIFFEKLVSPKLADAIAKEIGGKTLVLDPLEGLSDDDIRDGKDYFSVMKDNLKNLQIAMGCFN